MAHVSKRAAARVVDRVQRAAWLALAAGGLVLGAASYSRAQSVPTGRPIEIIVPFGPGGGADEVARFSAPMLQADMHSPVTVSNVSGATGNAGMARLLAAPSDGHTLAVLTNDTFASLAFDNATWKPDDVIALAIMTRQNSALFVPSGSPYARWQDFADHARKAPRSLRVAISGYGSPDYIALEQLSATGIALAPVPIDDPQQRFQAVLNGQADALYEQPGDVRRFLEAGQMRPVMMFSAARDPDFKDVPASGELGIGSGLAQFRAIVVKAGTDPQTVALLAGELDHMASTPEFKIFLARQMAASDSFATSKDARAFLQRQMATMQRVVAGMPMHARFPVEDKPRDEAAPPSF